MNLNELLDDVVTNIIISSSKVMTSRNGKIFSLDITTEMVFYINSAIQTYNSIENKPDRVFLYYNLKNIKNCRVLNQEKTKQSEIDKINKELVGNNRLGLQLGFTTEPEDFNLIWDTWEQDGPFGLKEQNICVRFNKKECWAVFELGNINPFSVTIHSITGSKDLKSLLNEKITNII